MKAFALLCVFLLPFGFVGGQDTTSLVGRFSSRYADKIEQKTSKIEGQLNKQSQKALQRLQKQQQKVYKALGKLDSNAAKTFLLNTQQQLEATRNKLKGTATATLNKAKTYVPGLDSMTGILKYLNKLPGKNGLPGNEKIKNALSATTKAGGAIDASAEVRKLMQQQAQQIKSLAARYKDLDVAKQLKAYNKEIYYYNQRIQGAKEMLNDPGKIEGEVLKLLRKNETFKSWMQQNGQLAGLFGNPNASTARSMVGLQTRQNVQQLLQSRMGGNVQQAQQVITNRMQQAQGQLNNLQNRLQQLGNNSGNDMAMPDFKPNSQHTKKWFDRLEKGWNLQTTQRKGRFPSVNELGINLGYRLSDKKVVGIGLAYRFGLGEGINKMRWTHEGLSLRSYIDMKWKGNLWISGGYEQTYWSRFSNNQFNSIVWQKSAMLGLTKKVVLKKNKEMKMQILYDFLDKNKAVKTLPFTIRTGYNF